MRAHQTGRERGFSLIELMVALAVLGIVASQLFVVFSTQRRVYVTNEGLLDVQEDARLIADLLSSETRMAGYLVPRSAAIASNDGGPTASDLLCVSDAGVIDPAAADATTDRFGGLVPTALNAGSLNHGGPAALNIDNDAGGTADFAVNRGLILSDGDTTHCAQIDTVTNTTITFSPAIPGGELASFTLGGTRAVPAIVYQLGGAGLTRNGVLLSSEVEDLQVEYAVDVNDNGLVDTGGVEFPLNTLDGVTVSQLQRVRLTIVTRTVQSDRLYDGPGFPGPANRAAGARDGFRRRVFVAEVLPRNIL
jgi:prepilin-type N-terminal cleavage/methylation domain-containing protein